MSENQPLLTHRTKNSNNEIPKKKPIKAQDTKDTKPPLQHKSVFVAAYRNLKTLAPSIYPSKDPVLQVFVLICMLIIIADRVVNLYVPIFNGYIVNSLTSNGTEPIVFRFDYILTYAGLRAIQSSGFKGGVLSTIRVTLWVKVSQYTAREVQLQLFAHLHKLSLKWHLSRKTGEVLGIMDRGTKSINQLIYTIAYQIVPTFLDLIIGIVYFFSAFNFYFALIVVITMTLYLIITIYVTEYRAQFRRKMNDFDNTQRAKAADSLLNFETKSQYMRNISWAVLSCLQSIIISSGLLAGCLLCAYFVVNRDFNLTVGDYILYVTFLQQLDQPLEYMGMFYSTIQQNLLDMENMCQLLDVTPGVRSSEKIVDVPHATPLLFGGGKIEFRNVSFHYLREKPILQNVSFIIESGKSLALVGPSGSGKSTIIRLLFRFYDVNTGSILLDNQDIRLVPQKEVRDVIGVVPQDTVLFNDSIRYNIRYGRVSASDSETEAASEAADIHHNIMNFPDRYQTAVGERGLKLSGGEKQRVAIARTLLKAPPIVVLDEATSSLDTQTERNIQASLKKIASGRTTLVVSHRLSSIVDCDEIAVLVNGIILERGRHDRLMSLNGVYANMWNDQATTGEMHDEDGSNESNRIN